ncbi:regulatory protein GemA [Devosia sp.]|jgi:hypothetical protein|uniref:regulatory protein GemA n=1 Tax=Devosia sp. TaxID=1871048 RepID=UPI0037C1107C
MAGVSSGQIAAIHTLKARAGLDDASYRQLLDTVAGVRSSTALTHVQAALVIDRLKGCSTTSQTPRALALSGPYVGICRALWIAGWHLGLVGQREDSALVAFVARQTGLDHLNWLRDPADAAKVIEALKAWLARDAGVRWPSAPTGMAAVASGR